VTASRDVTINEKDHWNWDIHDESSQSTLPFIFEDDHDDETVVATTPTPIVNTEPAVRRSERGRIPNRICKTLIQSQTT
ncbi:hypothetical protein A2U01_0092585, partial [Trifolium medium]|nr:hypothetical protein [Trifolium medium]